MNALLLRAVATVVLAAAPQALFDGRSLRGWRATDFGGEGAVRVEKGELRLYAGDPLTGVTWAGGALPKADYEIALQAKKVSGDDFFCALTFTVGDAPISFIVGGWGGTVVGLSSLDGMDASENETSSAMTFANGRWYRVRVRVAGTRIAAWIDDAQVVDVDTRGRRVSVRPEVEASRPLGIASYRTTAALRAITVRRL